MNIALKGAGLLALLLLIGGGCDLTKKSDESHTGDTMVEESNVDGTVAEGETMQKDDDAMEDDSMVGGDAMKDENDAMMEDGQAVKGRYDIYTSPNQITHAATEDVVLFFHASWCPSCKALNTDIVSDPSNIPDELTILKVDYDTETDLKKKYGVTYQHTLVQVDGEGNMIKKWSGGNALESVTSQVQ